MRCARDAHSLTSGEHAPAPVPARRRALNGHDNDAAGNDAHPGALQRPTPSRSTSARLRLPAPPLREGCMERGRSHVGTCAAAGQTRHAPASHWPAVAPSGFIVQPLTTLDDSDAKVATPTASKKARLRTLPLRRSSMPLFCRGAQSGIPPLATSRAQMVCHPTACSHHLSARRHGEHCPCQDGHVPCPSL